MTLLNFREELRKFKAINLEVLEESISDLPDDIRNSIALYNKAIESIEKGSEDIAIIELKKAVSINPNFYEALNLLGLCYAYTGEKDRAAGIFEQVIESERNGIQAYVYRKQFGGEMPEVLQSYTSGQEISDENAGKAAAKRAISRKTPVQKVQVSNDVVLYPKKKSSFGKSVLKFGTGLIAGALIVYLAAYLYAPPPADENVQLSNENEIIALEEDKAMLQRELNNAETRYKELEGKYNSLAGELEQANGRVAYLTGLRKLMDIGLLETENKYEEAADTLLEIDYNSLESSEKTWYDTLRAKIMPEAANIVYNEGRDFCQKESNYEKGIEKLEKVLLYDENFRQLEALLYYTGKCHQGVGNYEKAMEYYNRILTEYPGGYYSQYVRIRISEINAATAGNSGNSGN